MIYICWEDWRTSSASIYSQVLNYDGLIQLPENGTEIFGGLSGETYNLKILPNGDNPFLIWEDWRNSQTEQIYIQSLNSDGLTVFVEDGIPITTFSQNEQEEMDSVLGENSEAIAIVWSEIREGYAQIYAQGINTSGNYLWSDSTGLKVAESTYHQDIPMISVKDNSGTDEYYIGLEDFTDYMNSQIKGQKIINGNLEWGAEGKIIVDREGNDKLNDVIENYYIWQSVEYQNENIFCLMVDEYGDPAPGWSEEGLEVCVEDGTLENVRAMVVPNGILVVWSDFRNGNWDIYGQVVTPNGNILWQENGLPLIEQENYQVKFKFIYDDGLYVVWQDFRSGCNYEIYAQKFDEFGNELWQEGGILIAGDDDSSTSFPDVVKVGNKIVVVWSEFNNYNTYNDIKVQLLNENGDLLWNPQGLFVCNEFGDQSYPQVVSNGYNDAYIAWLDKRAIFLSTGFQEIQGVYAQKVYIEPSFVNDEIIKPIDVLCNYPNPFNPETTISFFTAEDAKNAELVIYNIKGQKVKILVNEVLPAGEHSAVWDGKNTNNKAVASGIYFYNLKVGRKSIAAKKCLLLK